MSELTKVNYLNLAAYVISCVLNSGGEQRGPDDFFGFPGIAELGRRYESNLTPSEFTFLITKVTLLFEGVFAVAQMMPSYRSSSLVQDSVKYWYFGASMSQLLWSICFGREGEGFLQAFTSLVWMCALLFCLSTIVVNQANNAIKQQTPEEYWLLRFPFSIHVAWIMAAVVINIDALFVALGAGEQALFFVGVLSVIVLKVIGAKMLFFNGDKPNYVIPFVMAWVTFGIANGGGGPDGFELNAFSIICSIISIGIFSAAGYLLYKNEIAGADLENEKEYETGYVAPV